MINYPRANSYSAWSKDEKLALCKDFESNLFLDELVAKYKRSEHAICLELKKQGLLVRKNYCLKTKQGETWLNAMEVARINM